MEQDKKQREEEITDKQKWFQVNHRYTTICIYALIVIVCGTAIAMMIVNWSATKAFIMHWFSVLSPFWAALLIAYFLRPIVDGIDRTVDRLLAHGKHRKIVRYTSIFLAYIFVIGCIILVINFIIPQLTHSITELTASVPAIYDRLATYLMGLEDRYPELDMTTLLQKLQNMVPDLVNFGTNIVGNGLVMIYSLSISVVRMVINVLLAVMISIYMIASEDFFREQAKRLVYAVFNEQSGNAICRTCKECNSIFSAFLLSKALDSLIIGCLCCMIMSVLGLPYAVLLSVIVGITNMIPYFGPFIGAIPGVLIYLCLKPMDAIIFAIMILVLQQFDGLVLGPRLLGQSTGLNPIWVIFAITVGGAYFGVIGMFIGVPVVAVVAYLLNKLIKYRLKNRNIKALQEFSKES